MYICLNPLFILVSVKSTQWSKGLTRNTKNILKKMNYADKLSTYENNINLKVNIWNVLATDNQILKHLR